MAAVKLQPFRFSIGEYVIKDKGDYVYEGTIVTAFYKLKGEKRYVVEDATGLLMIMNEKQIRKVTIINA